LPRASSCGQDGAHGIPVREHLDAQRGRPVRDHLDSLIAPTTGGTSVPLGVMMNPVRSHLDSLVEVKAGETLPHFCLQNHNLPPMSLERAAGSASRPITSVPTAQSGTRQLPGTTHTGSPDPVRLREIQEGILQHNLECQQVQAHLNRECQRLH
jgi:hypothetical protein